MNTNSHTGKTDFFPRMLRIFGRVNISLLWSSTFLMERRKVDSSPSRVEKNISREHTGVGGEQTNWHELNWREPNIARNNSTKMAVCLFRCACMANETVPCALFNIKWALPVAVSVPFSFIRLRRAVWFPNCRGFGRKTGRKYELWRSGWMRTRPARTEWSKIVSRRMTKASGTRKREVIIFAWLTFGSQLSGNGTTVGRWSRPASRGVSASCIVPDTFNRKFCSPEIFICGVIIESANANLLRYSQ